MWILRFLNGPLAGQIVPLTKRTTTLGRSSSCDIRIPSGSVSKEHTRIEVFDDKVIVSDAGSRNGTFLNGVQVRSSKAKSGDKIGIHEIFFEVQKVPENWAARFQQQQMFGAPQAYGNVAYQRPPPESAALDDDGAASAPARDFSARLPAWANTFQDYMDRVVLPGILRLPEMFEFRWVLAGFVGLFILMTTALSMIPLNHILKSSIEEESQQHAMTIATTLARVNRPFLTSGQEGAASVEIALSRPGVRQAFLISSLDGNIIAPANQAGSYPNVPFVHEARKFNKESVKQVDDNTVVALYPILVFNQEGGSQSASHWAVVVYDMSSLAVKDGQILSLFITTLFIALILGVFLYYFLYKIVEYPIRSINRQLDTALKEGGDAISMPYLYPPVQLLASNISSALTRTGSSEGMNRGAIEHDRNREITNLVELVGFACMGVHAHDLSIAAVNQALESRLGLPASQITSGTINDLNDQSLKLSVKDLIERVDKNPDELAANPLEFSGTSFQVVVQAVFGTSKIAYYLVVLLPTEEGG